MPAKSLYPRPQGLSGFLDRSPQLRAGLAKVRADQRINTQLFDAIPAELRPAVYAARASGSSLVISVTSAEAAHIIRLQSATLLRSLADKGLKFNEIYLSMQSISVPNPGRKPARIGPESVALRQAAAGLKNKRLQESLQKLAATAESKARK